MVSEESYEPNPLVNGPATMSQRSLFGTKPDQGVELNKRTQESHLFFKDHQDEFKTS